MEARPMMDFTLDDTQSQLRDVSRQIFEAHGTHDRLKELSAGGQSFDNELWQMLDRSGLLGLGVEDSGLLEQCVVLIEQGRTVAPVPLWSHLIGNAVAKRPEGIVTVAIEDGADGEKVGVPALDIAEQVVVSDSDALYVVAADPGAAERRETTAGFPEFVMPFDVSGAERLEGNARDLKHRAVIAICAIGVGVAERALELTATYTSERKQFDKPLGSFQAVQQRAADAYIDVEAMRTTMWQAAWRLSEGLDAEHAVRVAKFWAAEGGQRVVSAAQHLHGGMGSDIDYPLFRYTLWSKWVELAFGGATQTLASMGAEL